MAFAAQSKGVVHDAIGTDGGTNHTVGLGTVAAKQELAALYEQLLEANVSGERVATNTLLVVSSPCSGKTAFAVDALLEALDRFGDGATFLAEPNRQIAQRHADEVIRKRQSTSQARPVTTLSAIAFQVLTSVRFRLGLPLPQLLSGAEQDALLRQVVATHVQHTLGGDECETCRLFRAYFAYDDWVSLVAGADALADTLAHTPTDHQPAVLASAVNLTFIEQLRDMLARVNEYGVTQQEERALLENLQLDDPDDAQHMNQWRLAFALRHEYAEVTAQLYPDQWRLDASQLFVEASLAVQQATQDQLPQVIIVDDAQDLTYGSVTFLQGLGGKGVRLVLVGSPDEAVQTYRGSNPDSLFQLLSQAPLHAKQVALGGGTDSSSPTVAAKPAPNMRKLVASRVSLSIQALTDDDTPLPARPWKLPSYDGAYPIAALDQGSRNELGQGIRNELVDDGSVHAGLYRSTSEELDDVVWQIKRLHVYGNLHDSDDQFAPQDSREVPQEDQQTSASPVPFNDMAIIAHDNSVVRLFGERLRRDGVPVRYSSVTKPLHEEAFVQGLFALIELARLRNDLGAGEVAPAGDESRESEIGAAVGGGSAPTATFWRQRGKQALAAFVRSRVAMILESPLVDARGRNGQRFPARLQPVEALMQTLTSLTYVEPQDATNPGDKSQADTTSADVAANTVTTALHNLEETWRELVRQQEQHNDEQRIHVDDSVIDQTDTAYQRRFDADALFVLLAHPNPNVTHDILGMLQRASRGSANVTAFATVFSRVEKVAKELHEQGATQPQYALDIAWRACNVAEPWQMQALANDELGRLANDRLDTAMRLFAYASGSGAQLSVPAFIEQVRSMQVQADSLAQTAPIDQAVTLTTPAGAGGRHWPQVWIPALQQGVWPNLKPRNTMFAGEQFDERMLQMRSGSLTSASPELSVNRSNVQLMRTLVAEQRNFLVALTRACRTVRLSAVYDETTMPSDLLYAYLPELYDRAQQAEPQGSQYTLVGGAGQFATLDMDQRGIIAAARVIVSHTEQPETGADNSTRDDAATALGILAQHGWECADPDQWNFVRAEEERRAITTNGNDPTADNDANNDEHNNERSNANNAVHSAKKPDDQQGNIVSLTPSSVDSIWACPVCWMLERRFAGPTPGGASLSFGSLVHEVAQYASEQGYDLPTFMSDKSEQERIQAISDAMMEHFRELSETVDPDALADIGETYRFKAKERSVRTALENIANYFVTSNSAGYATNNKQTLEVGTLEQARCEMPFSATLTLKNIQDAYNAMQGVKPVTRDELVAIMGALVGGWPHTMSADLAVKLHGRIDRQEFRMTSDGTTQIRLIDYKTGHGRSLHQKFNDLQLVCYQLGVAFDPDLNAAAAEYGNTPLIAHSALFQVDIDAAPAQGRLPEALFQPPLLVDGHLNDSTFTPRSGYPTAKQLIDVETLDASHPPEGVNEELWEDVLRLQGTQAIWALTMVARVWYAAAASTADFIVAHPTKEHLAYCRTFNVCPSCPACAGELNTVYEVRSDG